MTREASLAHAIHAYHDGGLSHEEFFAQVDHLLAGNHVDAGGLLKTIGDERLKRLLPNDMYAELRGRIERLPKARPSLVGEETRVMTSPDGRYGAPTAPSGNGYAAPPGAEVERVKGVGDTLNGRFVLEECIGFGGMGTVYKALDLRKLEASDRKPYIAIKVLNVQFRGHPKSLIALQREARKAQALAHPNIVTVYDFDRDGATVFLTMELLSGKPLSQVLRKQGFTGLPELEALRIVTGIAKGLEYAHERGFVHCDLKPGNVFLTDKGEVKVIDFGIARVFHKPEEEVEATVFDPGSLGAMTPAYASPEMQEHRDPDPRDDIYALACITYELFTGRHPFDRLSALQARGAGMKPQRPKNLGHRQWRAICHALAFEREDRTRTVTQFLEEMSTDKKVRTYAALVGSSVLMAVVFAGAFNYYKDFRDMQRAGQLEASNVPDASQSPATTPDSSGASDGKSESAPAQADASPPVLTMDAVMPVMSRMPCSALMATVQGQEVKATGYIPASYGARRLTESLSEIPGVKKVTLDVQEVTDHECSVIKTFAPYWVKNHQAKNGATIKTKAPKGELHENDPLIVDITTPPFDSHVYVDYHVLDGSVVHMVPSPRVKTNQAPPSYSATIGSFGNWVISKPFGNEMIVLITTPAPLFTGMRPEVEPGTAYLQSVEKQLAQLASKYGAERIGVDFVRITTSAKK
ncbi:MAG: protein kinase [Burkholderiales bacterium]|nr:protein kinase [Burkholderiales bacterium]